MKLGVTAALLSLSVSCAWGSAPVLHIDAGHVVAHVSPLFYGIMTEEINHSYDGGLYAELISNRTFQDDARDPVNWFLTNHEPGAGAVSLDPTQPLNDALKISLKLEVKAATAHSPVGVANRGFWGIPVRPDTCYRASFYAKADPVFSGPLRIAILSKDGATTYAAAQVPAVSPEWKKYEVSLTTTKVAPTEDAVFAVTATSPGTLWLNVVSLFPPTWNDRPNGLRKDLMLLLADYGPHFLRFPGGNYLEGNAVANRFDWKTTVGDISRRPTHQDDAWGYRSSDGMGLLEFLEWCEDLKMEPVMAVYGAFSIEEHAAPEISPYVQDALDEIEYAAGGTTTKWGAQRAKDGHRAPFPIHYIEVGNEDNWNQGALTYNERFAAFYDAIKAKYPGMEIIATTRVTSRRPDFQDDHAYFNSSDEAERAATRYDKADRNGPKILFGEYATQTGGIPNLGRPETSNLDNALGDAAFLTGLERNSDIVLMASYAPLFINMNPGAAQWRTDLIGYDALHVFGSVSYYAQKMFSHNLGDEVLAGEIEGLSGSTITLFYSATRDSKTERIYLKVVNTAAVPQPLRVDIRGVDSVAPTGCLTMLTSAKPTDMNSLAEPTKVVPIATKVSGLGPSFTRTLPPYSISIFQLQAN